MLKNSRIKKMITFIMKRNGCCFLEVCFLLKEMSIKSGLEREVESSIGGEVERWDTVVQGKIVQFTKQHCKIIVQISLSHIKLKTVFISILL